MVTVFVRGLDSFSCAKVPCRDVIHQFISAILMQLNSVLSVGLANEKDLTLGLS